MVRNLWGVGTDFRNKEVFSVSIEILKPLEQLYLPTKIKFRELVSLSRELGSPVNLLEIGKTTYHSLVRRWIDEILRATLQTMKPFGLIPENFFYTMKWSQNGSIKITGNHPDELVNKKFLEIIAPIFGPVTNEKYVIKDNAEKRLIDNLIPKSIKWLSESSFETFFLPNLTLGWIPPTLIIIFFSLFYSLIL